MAVGFLIVASGAYTPTPEDVPGKSNEGSAEGAASRINVVWILLDACRAQNLSCYGYERKTSPNIDRLASRGVLFEQHFTQGLMTAISVPSYMTGRDFAANCVFVGPEHRGLHEPVVAYDERNPPNMILPGPHSPTPKRNRLTNRRAGHKMNVLYRSDAVLF